MIVAMKKVSLLILDEDKEQVLTALRDLGVMQITEKTSASAASVAVRDRYEQAKRTIDAMYRFAEAEKLNVSAADSGSNGSADLEAARKCLDEAARLKSAVADISNQLEALAVWGDFDRKQFDELREKGVNILLCKGSDEDFESAGQLENVDCVEISRVKKSVAFAVISLDDLDAKAFPAVKLAAGDDPRALKRELARLEKLQESNRSELIHLLDKVGSMAKELDVRAGELEFSRAYDELADYGRVVVLDGFVPDPEMPVIREAAIANGWGVVFNDPEPGENVPVLVKPSKFSRFIRPLFDFLGIEPGYEETDASPIILVFFTIFYAMIIGDAGYGLLFLLPTLAGMYLLRRKPAAKLPLRLMLILSCASVVWGILCGSYFGVSFGGLKCLTDEAVKNTSMQVFCFMLAVAQLSVGRIWKAFADKNIKSIISNFGWVLVIAGNFFLTYQLLIDADRFPPQIMYALYGSGLIMVALTGVNWKDPADIFQFPFSIIGSFTDVLSYIRLFAVGMAGACIAQSFNDMGMGVAKASPWFIIFGILVMVFGHLLNLALAMMSVLVHAVRLNTLEFSNHVGLTWSGQKYTPFKNNNQKQEGK